MIRIAIVLGSTRPGRLGKAVADWVSSRASERGDATFAVLDVADFRLPILDEPLPPSFGRYSHAHTKAWSDAVDGFDGYIFVTGEYNHSIPGGTEKRPGLPVQGVEQQGGRVRQLRKQRRHPRRRTPAGEWPAELQMADVRAQVALPLATEFANYRTFIPRRPRRRVCRSCSTRWSPGPGALKILRPDHAHGTKTPVSLPDAFRAAV